MNADQVRAYVAAKWPGALQSPAARLMAAASAMAALEASDPDAVIKRDQDLRDAKEHAEACLATRGGWDVEALSDNIRSEFWQHLTSEDCDDVARKAIAIWAQPADRGRFAEFSDSEIDVIREALQFLGPRTLGVDRSICEDLVTEIGPRAPATTKVPS